MSTSFRFDSSTGILLASHQMKSQTKRQINETLLLKPPMTPLHTFTLFNEIKLSSEVSSAKTYYSLARKEHTLVGFSYIIMNFIIYKCIYVCRTLKQLKSVLYVYDDN